MAVKKCDAIGCEIGVEDRDLCTKHYHEEFDKMQKRVQEQKSRLRSSTKNEAMYRAGVTMPPSEIEMRVMCNNARHGVIEYNHTSTKAGSVNLLYTSCPLCELIDKQEKEHPLKCGKDECFGLRKPYALLCEEHMRYSID